MRYEKYVTAEQDFGRIVIVYKDVKTDKAIDQGPIRGDKLATYGFIQDRLKKMLGKTLTILDAAIADKIQNKALKDLVKGAYIDEYTHVCEMLIDMTEYNDEKLDFRGVTEVSEDEALGLK